MNALLFSPSDDLAGGAVIAANRLFNGLQKNGVNTKMLTGRKTSENKNVNEIAHNLLGEKILSRFTMPLGLNYLQYYSSYRIADHPFFKEADVLNFHTIHSGYFNYRALPKLTKHKPAVFTLHDQWSFTGHCGFSYDCERWKTGCGKCPYPKNYPPIKYDNTAWEWRLKKKVYENAPLTFVTPSKWLASLAKQSMLAKFDIHVIENGLDTNVFAPLDPDECKQKLNIPKEKKVLLFGAMGLSDHRKGGDLLLKALEKMPSSLKSSIVLLTFGHMDETFKSVSEIPFVNLGYISDDKIKSIAFSAADIFIFPTRNDNFPCIVQESLACGTPVVSFDLNGIPELVRNGTTGYLAKPEDPESLLQKIVQLLEEDKIRAEMKLRSRAIAVEEYGVDLQSKRYAELFSSLLNKK